MEDQEKVFKYLEAVEKLAEEILADRHEIIVLDKRRNQNREALRELAKLFSNNCWLTVGSILIKHDKEVTRKLLEDDQKQLNIDINKLRSDLKVKVNSLRDLEMQPAVPGMMLVPMSQNETLAMSNSGLI